MQTGDLEPAQPYSELLPSNVIRVETALSRYPVHRIAKQGIAAIEIREQGPNGEILVQWEVSHNNRHGQPGPLAYKLDTLILNRRIEEASRPIPKIIRLGSLHDICRELDLGGDTNKVKKALLQNASAFIDAKFRYTLADGRKRDLEASFNRYSVVFTGEELPDGRKADGVFLVLNDIFMQVLNGAKTRPLDYDYLKDLPPGPQRLYEILSYRMYGALKNGLPRAKLSYGEFCIHAPLTRHVEWLRVRTQMNKLHAPHKESGYIASVEFEQTTDQAGKPDWNMLYTPGPKARAEYRAFTKRGGPRTLEIEQTPPAPVPVPCQGIEPSPLEQELIKRGVRADVAATLVTEISEEQVLRQVEHFDWLKEKHPKKVAESPGGFLAEAIRRDYPTPQGFETRADREMRLRAEEAKRRKEANEARRKQAENAREREMERRITERWDAMTPDEQASFERLALAESDEDTRQTYETTAEPAKRFIIIGIRRGYLRRLIESETASR